MSSNFRDLRRLTLIALGLCVTTLSLRAADPTTQPSRRILRITSDPNNLPFSNDKLEGFENKIAALIAQDLNADLDYTWRAQRRGFFKHSLKEKQADLVMGVPAHFEMANPTQPYYRSCYTFVTRKDRNLDIASFDDERLKTLKIGVQVVGDDGFNTPPVHALAKRGISGNLVGFHLYGDYRDENPTSRIMTALERGDIDIAVVWGPTAGYFANKAPMELRITPVSPDPDGDLKFSFAIAVGVQKGDEALKEEINRVLAARQQEIERILKDYKVPLLPLQASPVQTAEKK